MSDDQFQRLCNTFGFAPSRALREMIDAATRQAVVAEREACAKVCEENGKAPDDHKAYEGYEEGYQDGSNNCAAAIRSRT